MIGGTSKIRVGVISAFALLMGIAWIANFLHDQRQPDYSEMRRHVISRLTDDQIRKAHDDAQVAFDQEYAQQKRELAEGRKKKTELLNKCWSDLAFKERHPIECQVPLTWAMELKPELPSVAQYYEQMIMGICLYVHTVREAKQRRCLPQ